MKKHIKAFAALCSMVMVFGSFSFAALASDPDTATEIDQAYIDEIGGTMPTTEGDYVLTEDIAVSDTALIDTEGAEVSIDLAGHTITYSGAGSLYVLGKVSSVDNQNKIPVIDAGNIQLTIKDTSSDESGLITTSSGSPNVGSTDHWISYDKVGTDIQRGGCILIECTCRFNFMSGTISGFKAGDEGGAVHVSNGGEFFMTGGTITNCRAKNGGAVAVHTASGGRANKDTDINVAGYAEITGGKIINNYASQNGGGVRVLRGDFHLGSCVITGNKADGTGTNGGGGLTVAKPDPKNYSQVLEIEGSPKIYDNTGKNADRKNVFLYNNPTFTLVGNLTSDAKIDLGEYSWNTNHDYFITDVFSYDISSFTCGNTSYFPYYNSNAGAIRVRTDIIPSILGCNVTVGGSIHLNVKVNLGQYDDENTSITYAYSYTKNTKTVNVDKTLSVGDLTPVGDDYRFTIPVETSCMTAPITITIYFGNDNEKVDATFTIENYVKTLIAGDEATDGEKAVAEALLTYGGYAQVQLGINTDMLPTDLAVSDFTAATTMDSIEGASYTPETDPNGAYAGATLVLLSTTDVNLYFKKSALGGDSAPDMTVTFFGNQEMTIEGKSNGSYYMYSIKGPDGNGFLPAQYDLSFSFVVGDVQGSYSVEKYLKAAKASSSTTQSLINLVEAYYDFAKKCEALER